MSRSVEAKGESTTHRFAEQRQESAYPETAGSLLAAALSEASLPEPSDREERAALYSDI